MLVASGSLFCVVVARPPSRWTWRLEGTVARKGLAKDPARAGALVSGKHLTLTLVCVLQTWGQSWSPILLEPC